MGCGLANAAQLDVVVSTLTAPHQHDEPIILVPRRACAGLYYGPGERDSPGALRKDDDEHAETSTAGVKVLCLGRPPISPRTYPWYLEKSAVKKHTCMSTMMETFGSAASTSTPSFCLGTKSSSQRGIPKCSQTCMQVSWQLKQSARLSHKTLRKVNH